VKPAPFEYAAPTTLVEAVHVLDEHADDGKVLAGGQSLVPTMNFRLATPAFIVDLNGLDGLRYVTPSSEGTRIGALTRHVDLLGVRGPSAVATSLRVVAPHIGHAAIRNRGTFCGSIAHADPASEWCVLAAALDARIAVESANGSRQLGAADFFQTVFTTALEPNEIVREVVIPELAGETTVAFEELARRAGDFALVMAYAAITVRAGRVVGARVALGGVADVPVRARDAEVRLIDAAVGDVAAVEEAARLAADACRPSSDLHATAEYRRRAAAVLTRRTILRAIAQQP
jgi:carbon-monoxide dehydrogenase medium subunit